MVDAADDAPGAEAIAAALGRCNRLLIVGSGLDYPAARELALKIEEGVHLPAAAHQLETIRHGHLAAADDRTGLVLLLTDGEERGEDGRRAGAGRPALGGCAGHAGRRHPRRRPRRRRARGPDPGGRVGGRDEHARCHAASAPRSARRGPLQLVAERLARARGMNPDSIGRDDPRQAAAADA